MRWWKQLFSGKKPRAGNRRGAGSSHGPGHASLGAGARRVPFHGRVRLIQGQHVVAAKAGDLSEGGLFVETKFPPGVGSKVRVFIELDRQIILHMEAFVRWIRVDDRSRVTGCGLLFEPLSVETRAALRAALDLLEAEASAPAPVERRWAAPRMNA